MGKTKEETQLLLEEHNSFKEKAKETREKVKLLLVLADTLMEKGHAHAMQIKSWVEEVNFSEFFRIFFQKFIKQAWNTFSLQRVRQVSQSYNRKLYKTTS